MIILELLNGDQGKLAVKKYISLAKTMRDFEETVILGYSCIFK
jgi:hypothetical protein